MTNVIVVDRLTGETVPLPAIKTHLTAHLFPDLGEVNTEPSMTHPDESMSIRDILERFTSGREVRELDGEYDEEESIMDAETWSRMDLVERAEFLQECRDEISRLEKKVAEPVVPVVSVVEPVVDPAPRVVAIAPVVTT